MLRAILKYKSGLVLIRNVDSEPNGSGGHFVNDYVNDGETVFKYDHFRGVVPIYEEIDVTMEDHYGYGEA